MVSIHPMVKDDFIRFFSTDDEKLQELGQILSTPTSRQIYNLLHGQELRNSEIARKLRDDTIPKLSNFTHHLQKMANVGILVATKRPHNGRELLFYTAVPYIVITPPENTEKAKGSKTLKNVFRTVFKIGAIGIPALVAFHLQRSFNQVILDSSHQMNNSEFILPLLIVIGGLITERILHSRIKIFNKYRISHY